MAEPSWSFLGSTGDDLYATFEWDGETYYGGWADAVFQIYEIPSINTDDSRDDNYYACTVSMAHQDPAWDGTNGKSSDFPDGDLMVGPRNERAEVGIDWNIFDAYSSSDLQDYKPSSGKSGDYSYSASVSAPPTAGSIGISYDPEDIERETADRTGDEVIWNWDFPITADKSKDDLAAYADTNLSAGSTCKLMEPMDMPDDNDLCRAWYRAKFEAGNAYSGETEVSEAYIIESIEERDIT